MKVFLILFSLFASSYSFAFKVTLELKKPNQITRLQEFENSARYTPNSDINLGIKTTFKYFFLKYGVRLPGTNFNRNSNATNSYRDFRIGLPFKSFLIEVFYSRYKGFTSNEDNALFDCDSCVTRERLNSKEVNAQFFYALNSEFNIRKLVSDGGEDVEESGSFLFHGFINFFKFEDPTGLAQGAFRAASPAIQNLLEVDLRQVGAGLGYAYTYPFYDPFYISIFTGAAIGAQVRKSNFTNESIKTKGPGTIFNVKALIGTSGLDINYGIKALAFSNIYRLTDDRKITTLNYKVGVFLAFNI